MEWIEIKKIKPQFNIKVLTWNEDEPNEPCRTDTLTSIKIDANGETLNWYEGSYPTHWMPLPEPPKSK